MTSNKRWLDGSNIGVPSYTKSDYMSQVGYDSPSSYNIGIFASKEPRSSYAGLIMTKEDRLRAIRNALERSNLAIAARRASTDVREIAPIREITDDRLTPTEERTDVSTVAKIPSVYVPPLSETEIKFGKMKYIYIVPA